MEQATVEQVGDKFAEVLKEWLTPQEWDAMRKKNREWKDDAVFQTCCASHDFCDANMAMEEAMRSLGLVWDQNIPSKHVELWNAAWAYAKEKHFTAEAA